MIGGPMPRKKLNESERLTSVRLSVSLPQQLHDQLEQKAHENDASIAWVVRRAVSSYLNGSGGNPSTDAGH